MKRRILSILLCFSLILPSSSLSVYAGQMEDSDILPKENIRTSVASTGTDGSGTSSSDQGEQVRESVSANTYNVWISDVQVSAENKDNILNTEGTPTAVYTPAVGTRGEENYQPQKLTITNAQIGSIWADEDLDLVFEQNTTIQPKENSPGIGSSGTLNISGSGNVTLLSADITSDSENYANIYAPDIHISGLTMRVTSVSGNALYAYDATGGLNLTNTSITAISESAYPAMVGTGTIRITGSDVTIQGPGIHSTQADILVENSSLRIDTTDNLGLFARSNLSILGNSILNVKNGDSLWPAIGAQNNLTIGDSASVTVNSGSTGIRNYEAGTLTIKDNANVVVVADDYAIQSGSNIHISGGTVSATGSEDGIHGNRITVAGGKVTAEGKLAYGIYASRYFEMSQGSVEASGKNAGLYVSGESGQRSILIEGGSLTARSSNQYGIRALNGSVTILGGLVTSDGNTYGIRTRNSNCFILSGGTVEAYGASNGAFYALPVLTQYQNPAILAGTSSSDAQLVEASALSTESRYIKVARGYSLTYHLNGGSGQLPEAVYYPAGTNVTVISGDGLTPPSADSPFNGWSTNPDGTGDTYVAGDIITMENRDISLYAIWGGKQLVSISGIAAGENVVYTGNPQRGYTGTITYHPQWNGTPVITYYTENNQLTTAANSGAKTDGGEPVYAGNYKVKIAIGDSDENYRGSLTLPFTIQKAPLTIKPDDVVILVGDAVPDTRNLTYTVTGLVNGETAEAVLKVLPTLSYRSLPDSGTEGTYPISADNAAADNYRIIYGTGVLTVAPHKIWTDGITDLVYNGTAQKQTFKVYDGNTLLREKIDYTVSYRNNKNAYTYDDEERKEFEELQKGNKKLTTHKNFNSKKAPQVVLKMKGNYKGTKAVYFQIEPVDISNSDFMETLDSFNALVPAVLSNNRNQKPKPVLTWSRTNKALKLNKDYDAYFVAEGGSDSDAVLIKNHKSFIAPGDYTLTLVGKGNFTGTRELTYTIASKNGGTEGANAETIVMSKAKVASIKAQSWIEWQSKAEGGDVFVIPQLTVSHKSESGKALTEAPEGTEDGDYTVEWINNHRVGTATVILTGTGTDHDNDGLLYVGSISKTFKINGTAMNKVVVNNINKAGYTYTGSEILPTEFEADNEKVSLTNQVDKKNPSSWLPLTEDEHYTVAYSKNITKGTATITFTGIPESGYTGVKKQTFKIVAAPVEHPSVSENSVEISFAGDESLYMAKGATPEIVVTWTKPDGETVELIPKTDYTVSYKNNKKIYPAAQGESGFDSAKAPTVLIKGKGNFTGTKSVTFTINPKPIDHEGVTIVAADKEVSASKKGWRQSFKVVDENGKTLAAKDYDKASVQYILVQENGEELSEEVNLSQSPRAVAQDSIIEIRLRAGTSGNYVNSTDDGYAVGSYRILNKGYNIKSATIKIQPQEYTGRPIYITEASQFVPNKLFIRRNGSAVNLVMGTDFEVVENSYVKNTLKGTAKVTLKGIGAYGGTKTVTFKIAQRPVESHWIEFLKNLFNF